MYLKTLSTTQMSADFITDLKVCHRNDIYKNCVAAVNKTIKIDKLMCSLDLEQKKIVQKVHLNIFF